MILQVYQTHSGVRLSEEREGAYLARLPHAIGAEIRRFRRWEDKQASLFGKLLLRRALLSRNPEWEASILERLEYRSGGKPFIKGTPDFSISHSGDIVMVAMVDAGAIGIDVEKIRPIEVDDFSPYLPEISSFEALDTLDGLDFFYSCWTKKEAVLKGEGAGLYVPLDEVKLDGCTAVFHDRVWHLERIDCGADYCCHVATSEPQAGVRVEAVYFS